MSFRHSIIPGLCAMMLSLAGPAKGAPSSISSIAELRALPHAEASRGVPVHLRGVVALRTASGFYLDDGGVGIWAGFGDPSVRAPEGTEVVIQGVTAGAGYTPFVLVSKLAIVGKAPLPEAKRVPVERLLTGAEDSQRVELEGVIQQVVPASGQYFPLMVMSTQGQLCRIKIADNRNVDPSRFVDARVRVRGIFRAQVNLRNQSVGLEMHTRLADVAIIKPAPLDAFQAPHVEAAKVLTFTPADDAGHRKLVRGIVTFTYPGKFFYLQDGDTSLRVDAWQADLKPGDAVEVVGFPTVVHTLASLGGAVVRKTGAAALPEATETTPREILKPAMANFNTGYAALDASGKRVKLSGRLLRVIANADNTMSTLLVDSDGEVFPAFIPINGTSDLTWTTGSDLELTGICELEFKEEPADLQSVTHPISGFHLWLASADGIRVIQAPSWWTPQRLRLALGGGSAVLLATAIWVILLRREVSRRGLALAREIAARREAKLEFDTTMRERTRLASDLHDNLEQTLTGLSLQLQAADLFQSDDRPRSAKHLQLAQQFLDRSREDLHRTVWDLRAFGLEGKSLGEALREKTAAMTTAGGTAITVEEHPADVGRELPDFIAGNLLLLAQEAVTNALKHAGASLIAIEVDHGEDGITVSIRDDGKGFDPATAPDHREGHFGLQGMRERARRIGGSLEITSAAGSGTRIAVSVPREAFLQESTV